jgi:hypothetical protein
MKEIRKELMMVHFRERKGKKLHLLLAIIYITKVEVEASSQHVHSKNNNW